MLRKRANFKPNLSKVPAEPEPAPESGPKEAASVAVDEPTSGEVGDTAPVQTSSNEMDKRIRDAIEQLTDRFEPIKSVSLQNSANKNRKLKDLLFYNPPLTRDQKRHRKNVRKRLDELKSKTNTENDVEVVAAQIDEPSLVPKVKVGQDGQLILDESSTTISRKNLIPGEAIVEDNEEIMSRTNYDSYRRKGSASHAKWSPEDTKKFYYALTIFGSDFSMMESLLYSGHRSRAELHKKFKREERTNRNKIDIAISSRISLSSEELNELKNEFFPE